MARPLRIEIPGAFYHITSRQVIALNPVRAGLVSRPEEWNWGSFRALAGLDPGIPCLTDDSILLQFGKESKIAEKRFMEFVRAGLKVEAP
ncbi:MAG: hypothetical protein WHS38_00915 [Thermodesulforhabdaceae bacterium]